MLETTLKADNTFVTLTYNDESYPHDHSVTPRELQLFYKRLRKKCAEPIRYYGVGEYGDTSGRPHYHIALFGYPNCAQGISNYGINSDRPTCCDPCQTIHDAWGKGRIMLAELNNYTCQYIAGYVVKKMTKPDDPRLEGRLPEFARMSLRPGIGHDAMYEVASTLLSHNLEKRDDVPSQLQHGTKKYPLGRYLRRKLRKYVGKEEKAPQSTLEIQKEKLRPMRETAFANNRPFKEEILKGSKGRRIQLEKQKQIYKKVKL